MTKNFCRQLSVKVVKIDVKQSFCVNHHIDVHPDMSIAFVNMDARIFLLTFRQPSLQMATKNEF